MKIGPNKNSHPITVDNVMLLLYMYMRPLRGAGGMYVPGQISVGSFCVLRSRTCPCCYTVLTHIYVCTLICRRSRPCRISEFYRNRVLYMCYRELRISFAFHCVLCGDLVLLL